MSAARDSEHVTMPNPSQPDALEPARGAAGGRCLRGSWARAGVALVLVTVLALVSDLVTKRLAFDRLAGQPVRVERADVLHLLSQRESLAVLIPPHRPTVVVPHLLEFKLVLNPGAVFGLGAGQRVPLVVFTVLALGLGLWTFRCWTGPGDRAAHVGLGLILGGGLGNLVDRLSIGSVRDFIHPLPGVHMPFGWRNPIAGGTDVWPYVSNLADLWLLIGIAVLMVHLLRPPASRQRPGTSCAPAGPQPGSP